MENTHNIVQAHMTKLITTSLIILSHHYYIFCILSKLITELQVSSFDYDVMLLLSFFNLVVDILYRNIERLPELATIALKLKKEFRKLSVDVKRSVENVDIDEVKLIINLALKDNIRHVSTDMYLKTLDEIDSVKKIFPFLIKNDFVGYLNYGLLKEISELVENIEVKEKFDRYESEYKHLLNASTFNILMQVFHDYPDLSPWPEGSVLSWQEYLKTRFPNWANSLAPKEFSSEHISVLKDLRDPAALKEFEDIGVTKLQLPDEGNICIVLYI